MKINYRKEARGRDCQIRIPGVCSGDPSTVVLCHLEAVFRTQEALIAEGKL